MAVWHNRRDPRLEAFIAEELEESLEEGTILTGRFSGHVESDDPRVEDVVDEFDDLALAEAVAWARARAPMVLVRVGLSTHYDAGTVPWGIEGARPWPDGGLAVERRAGVGDRPGRWLARGWYTTLDVDDRLLVEAARDAIASDRRAANPQVEIPEGTSRGRDRLRRPRSSYEPAPALTFEVTAATRTEALARARQVGDAALERLRGPIGEGDFYLGELRSCGDGETRSGQQRRLRLRFRRGA